MTLSPIASAWTSLGERVRDFVESFGEKILVGMYRASSLAPAQMFYAHAEHVHQALFIGAENRLGPKEFLKTSDHVMINRLLLQ